ncbi:PEP-CTERM sorting domain-containing protein [Phycisphaeraceae bacterium D3-23]
MPVFCPSRVCVAACLLSCVFVPAAGAAEFEVFADQVGGFYGPYLPTDFSDPMDTPPIPMPDNMETFQNYFMGRTSSITGFTSPERRVFFIYDLTGTPLPAGEVVTGVSIDLDLLFGGTSALANFSGGFELIAFSSSTYSDDEILDFESAMLDPVDIWATFGTADPYGEYVLDGPMSPMPTMPGIQTIDLPGAIPDVEAAMGSSLFIVTARLVTYDPGPIEVPGVPDAIDPYEYVFGGTDVVAGGGSTTPPPPLAITTSLVPEPGSLAVLSLGGLALLRRRRRD